MTREERGALGVGWAILPVPAWGLKETIDRRNEITVAAAGAGRLSMVRKKDGQDCPSYVGRLLLAWGADAFGSIRLSVGCHLAIVVDAFAGCPARDIEGLSLLKLPLRSRS